MFSHNDSLCTIRAARKRDDMGSTNVLPIEELRGLARKRQRTDMTSCSTQSQSTEVQGKKSVQFDLSRNTYKERDISVEEIQKSWLSTEEAQDIKNELRLTVFALQNGLLNREAVCIRGLEAHADPQLSKEKRVKGRAFAIRIIQQQCLLKAMMGKVNEYILAKLSETLSASDTLQACLNGSQDASVAKMIHTNNSAEASKPTLESHGCSVISLLQGLAGVRSG